MSIENFEKAIGFLFPAEGGYVNHQSDKGGPTNMGITQKTFDNYRQQKGLPTENVKNITSEEAKNIYYEEYWLTAGADNIADPNLAVAVLILRYYMDLGLQKNT